ncbi:hypothetical protein BDP27DRAFT_1425033 [Rhodocollybia butyracea]|uniref:Uncharacterized protein n=1 Tax=Rhodocollybia butyracea TaxID=206335 RepID=A0A9P5PGF5_9AGAR|nr:hypothetical protein BDP27DRAFT_1425033 [Rhodocollybia butyracea]
MRLKLLGAGENLARRQFRATMTTNQEPYKEIISSSTISTTTRPNFDDAHRPKVDVLPRDVADAIRLLCKDSGVKEAVWRSEEFPLNDSAVYYFSSIGNSWWSVKTSIVHPSSGNNALSRPVLFADPVPQQNSRSFRSPLGDYFPEHWLRMLGSS